MTDIAFGAVVDDRYLVLERLGRGGSSIAVLVKDLQANALRVLKVQHSPGAARIAALENEAAILARLSHPNIVRSYDVGRLNNEYCYVVFEWIDGVSLRRVLKKKLCTRTELLFVLARMASAVNALHKVGALHRDIKPENVMVPCKSGHPIACGAKLIDLGLVRALTATGVGPSAQVVGQLSGTIRYMAPEQLAGHSETAATDIYALGLVIYEALFGVAPLTDYEVLEVLFTPDATQRLAWTGPFVTKRLTEDCLIPSLEPVSSELTSLLVSCLRRDPELRPRSLDGVPQLLERVAQEAIGATSGHTQSAEQRLS